MSGYVDYTALVSAVLQNSSSTASFLVAMFRSTLSCSPHEPLRHQRVHLVEGRDPMVCVCSTVALRRAFSAVPSLVVVFFERFFILFGSLSSFRQVQIQFITAFDRTYTQQHAKRLAPTCTGSPGTTCGDTILLLLCFRRCLVAPIFAASSVRVQPGSNGADRVRSHRQEADQARHAGGQTSFGGPAHL